MEWVEPFLRGCAGLLVTALLIGAAHLRYRRKEDAGAPGDIGLD